MHGGSSLYMSRLTLPQLPAVKVASSISLPYTDEHHRKQQLSHFKHLLRISSLASSTMSAYSSAVSRFLEYCHSIPSHSHHELPHPSAALDLDRCLEDYISLLFARYHGKNKQLAVNTVYGVYLFRPEFRGSLKRSEQLLRGWDRLTPSMSHPPLTWPVTVLIAIVLAKNGQIDAAIATLVAFDGLLRISEFTSLLVADISTQGDARRGTASTSSRFCAGYFFLLFSCLYSFESDQDRKKPMGGVVY